MVVYMMGSAYQLDLIQLSSDRNSEGIPREFLYSEEKIACELFESAV